MNAVTRIVMFAAAVGASGLAHANVLDIVANPGGALVPVSDNNSYAVRASGSFLFNYSEVFNTGSSAPGEASSVFYSAGPGKLDFGFSSVKSGGASAGSMPNLREGNQAPFHNYSIFQGRPDHMILSLDDNSRVDDDHGDMLVMMRAFSIPVPEPGTLALFGLGLAGLICARKHPVTPKVITEY